MLKNNKKYIVFYTSKDEIKQLASKLKYPILL